MNAPAVTIAFVVDDAAEWQLELRGAATPGGTPTVVVRADTPTSDIGQIVRALLGIGAPWKVTS